MSHIIESHYPWLEKNMEQVCKNYGIEYVNCVSAYGDKCSTVIHRARQANIPFYHAAAMYFLTYEKGEIRDATRERNGIYAKVDIADWIVENYHKYLYLFQNCGDQFDCMIVC